MARTRLDEMADLEARFPLLVRACSLIPGLRSEVADFASAAAEEERKRWQGQFKLSLKKEPAAIVQIDKNSNKPIEEENDF